MAVSNHDLKHSGTFFRKNACDLGFAATVLLWTFAPGGRLRDTSIYLYDFYNHEVYDIGTKILYETCLGHNSTHKAPTEELLVRILTKFCVDSESDVKT